MTSVHAPRQASRLLHDACEMWRELAVLSSLRFAWYVAFPVSFFWLVDDVWALSLVALGFLVDGAGQLVAQRLRRRVRARCFERTTHQALEKSAPIPEANVDSAFWAAELTEYALVGDVPAIVGSLLTLVVIAALALTRLDIGLVLACAVCFLLAAGVTWLASRRRVPLVSEVVARRLSVAEIVAASERDTGELTGSRARARYREHILRSTASWSRAQDRLERTRWLQHGAIRVAAGAAGLWLLWKYGFLSGNDGNVSVTLRSASDLLLLGSALPIARVLSSHAESFLSVHFSLSELPIPAPRRRGARRRLETRPKHLQMTGLKHRYGDKLVVDVASLELDLERPLIVNGENGTGKTTIAAVLGGVIDNSEGIVALDGIDARMLSGDDVAFVPQYPLSVLDLSVLENARLIAPDCSADELDSILEELGFEHACTAPMRALSRGEQQRVAIARALAKQPKLLILDEPDAWLDARGRQRLARALSRRVEVMSMFVVTHREEFEKLAGEVLELGEAGAKRRRLGGIHSAAPSPAPGSGESTA
jgi:ABC-type transport system involved in cytochrome bd biosynthesis fused ATPase/permease subunit